MDIINTNESGKFNPGIEALKTLRSVLITQVSSTKDFKELILEIDECINKIEESGITLQTEIDEITEMVYKEIGRLPNK
jgi:hypothetical protein